MVTHEEGLATVKRGLFLLGAITLCEVGVALLGKGYLIPGFTMPWWLMYIAMISMSLYKAYFIVKFFMHMGYEVRGMAMSVLLPCCLLIWAIFAFFQEGSSWGHRREIIEKKNERVVQPLNKSTGMIYQLKAVSDKI